MAFRFDPMPHTEARDRIAKLPLVSRDVMDGLLPELRPYAFTITGLDVGDQMARARDMIAAVPAGEMTWDKAKKEIAGELSESLGGKEAERRAELLLRTHTFRGYAAARYRTLMAQVDVFPYWQYKTHGDGNVRPSHAALNGKIFPAGHPIWQQIFPPWDWGCRCLVIPLSARAVRKMQEAGLKPQIDDGSLQQSQIVRPEIFDAAQADSIAKVQRLPSGVSLNPSQTWSQSPWSEPGNVRHTWELVQKRYADQPEVLAAFRQWAGETGIPDIDMTVADWLAGDAVTLWQPKKSRWRVDVDFEPGEEEALRTLLSDKGRQTFGQLEDVPQTVQSDLESYEAGIAGDKTENAAAWGPDGTLRENKRSRRMHVTMSDAALKDGIVTHNHPAGSPPSLQDVIAMVNGEAREMRVVTRDMVYRIQPGPRATNAFETLPGFVRRINAGDIVARELMPGMAWTEEQADSAAQHSVLAWLAEQGIIQYERIPR